MAISPSPEPPLFTECQPMLRHWWGLSLLAPAIILGAALGSGAGRSPWQTASVLVLATAFSVGMLGFAKLHTQLAADGVRIRFAPMQSEWRFTPWAQVRRAYLRTYEPLREFGGWGIRTFGGESEAYNAWGNQGLQLILNTGERLLIGTQQPEAMQRVLHHLRIAGARPEIED